MRAGHGADQVVGVVDRGDPVAHGVVHRVLEGLGAGLDRDHLGAQQPHPGHVQRLPLGVHLAHVDRALQAEQRGGRGRGHAVLTGAGLRDHPALAHPPGQQGLAQHVVDLVRAGVVEVLPLEQDDAVLGSATGSGVLGESSGLGDRARPTGVVGQQAGQLGGKLGVVPARPGTHARAGPARRTAPRVRTCRRTARSGRRVRQLGAPAAGGDGRGHGCLRSQTSLTDRAAQPDVTRPCAGEDPNRGGSAANQSR